MVRRLLAGLILCCCGICGRPAAEDRTASTELIHYIQEARKAGLKDGQIQENALKAGWPESAVKNALAGASANHAPTPKANPAPAVTTGATAPGQAPAAHRAAWEPSPDHSTLETILKDASGVPRTSAAPPPARVKPTTSTLPAGLQSSKNRGAPDDYEIGAGDVLQISVWKEPDASVQAAVVRPDGKISMPLLKDISVLGRTVVEAEQLITQELSRFITAPDVTVVVAAINSKKIYVTGAVKKEGPIPYTYQMTVLQALSEAGGLTDYAKRKRIYVLHNESGRQFIFPFDYDAALKGQRMELNRLLTAGDTVVVPH